MNKATLDKNVASLKDEMRVALQTVYDNLNSGQQKKIVKDEGVKTLFDRYEVKY